MFDLNKRLINFFERDDFFSRPTADCGLPAIQQVWNCLLLGPALLEVQGL